MWNENVILLTQVGPSSTRAPLEKFKYKSYTSRNSTYRAHQTKICLAHVLVLSVFKCSQSCVFVRYASHTWPIWIVQDPSLLQVNLPSHQSHLCRLYLLTARLHQSVQPAHTCSCSEHMGKAVPLLSTWPLLEESCLPAAFGSQPCQRGKKNLRSPLLCHKAVTHALPVDHYPWYKPHLSQRHKKKERPMNWTRYEWPMDQLHLLFPATPAVVTRGVMGWAALAALAFQKSLAMPCQSWPELFPRNDLPKFLWMSCGVAPKRCKYQYARMRETNSAQLELNSIQPNPIQLIHLWIVPKGNTAKRPPQATEPPGGQDE